MIIQPTIPYHLMGISYTAVIEVVTTTEEYAFILRTMYFHVAEVISNCQILSAFGLKSLFIIEKSSLVHFTDLLIPLPKLCLLSKIQSVLPLIAILMMYLLQATLISIPVKLPLTKKFLLFVNKFSVTQMIVEPTHFT